MRVSDVIKALRERCPCFEERVFGCAEFQGLQDNINPDDFPACYVFTISEDPQTANQAENGYQQNIIATVGVCYGIKQEDLRTDKASELAEDIKDQIFQALLGWCPDTTTQEPFEYSNFRILSSARGVAFFQVELTLMYVIDFTATRIPKEQEEVTAKDNFEKMHSGIDLIKADGKPDGNIELEYLFDDFYNPKE